MSQSLLNSFAGIFQQPHHTEMWNIVASIQQTLDEAAGLNQQPGSQGDKVPEITTVSDGEGQESVLASLTNAAIMDGLAQNITSDLGSQPPHGTSGSSDTMVNSSGEDNDGGSAEPEVCSSTLHEEDVATGPAEPLAQHSPAIPVCEADSTTAIVSAAEILPLDDMAARTEVSSTSKASRTQGGELASGKAPREDPASADVVPASVSPALPPAASPPAEGVTSAKELQLAAMVHSLQHKLEQCKPIMATVDALKNEGQLLSQQLGIERERWKQAVQEKKSAVSRAEQLQEQLTSYKTKEARWAETQASLQESNQSLKERVAVLESNIIKKAEEIRSIAEGRADAEERFRALSARLADTSDEANAQHERDTLLHQSEIERLEEMLLAEQQAHRQATSEHEQQLVALQRDLSATEARAHSAETQLLDYSRSASVGLQDLMREGQQAAETVQALQRQLAQKQDAITNLTIAQAASDAAATEAALQFEGRFKAAINGRKQSELELSKATAALAKAQLRCEELLRSQGELQTQNELLQDEVRKLRAIPHTRSTSTTDAPEANPPSPLAASRGGIHLNEAALVVSLLAHTPPPASPPLSAASGATPAHQLHQQRLEREVARLTKEVRRLKAIEVAAARHKAQLDALVPQHDVLLQMYGQMEEQLEDARSDAKQIKGVYQQQLDQLANALCEAQKAKSVATVAAASSMVE